MDKKYQLAQCQSQKQKLKLSQSMRQSLNFLSLPLYEIEKQVNKISEDNPFVEIEDTYTYSFKIDKDEYIDQRKESLEEAVINQLKLTNKVNDKIVYEILFKCDSNGYFKGNEYYISRKYHVPIQEVIKTRFAIMSVEPKGIASKDLKECLLAQVDNVKENQLLRKVIETSLDKIASNSFGSIKKECKCSDETLRECIIKIRKLNPRPATVYDNTVSNYIRPDLKIVEEDGDLKITPIRYFNIRVNKISKKGMNKEEKEKVINYSLQANILKNALYKREETILKIFTELVNIQKRYLKGETAKEICLLNDIAKKTNLNVSTISRAVKEKYYEFENDIYPLQSLFDKEVCGVSEDFYCEKLTELIKDNYIQSDTLIADKMNKMGIDTSRRTVSKYRKQLNIDSMYKRRRNNEH